MHIYQTQYRMTRLEYDATVAENEGLLVLEKDEIVPGRFFLEMMVD